MLKNSRIPMKLDKMSLEKQIHNKKEFRWRSKPFSKR